MSWSKLGGWGLVAGGTAFLLFGMRLTLAGPFFLDRLGHGLAVLNGVTGASLLAAGVRRLGSLSGGRLVAVWVASFLLVQATSLFGVVFPLILGAAFGLSWASRHAELASPRAVWLIGALVAAVTLLVVSMARRRAAQGPPAGRWETAAARGGSWLLTALGYGGLATLGTAAGWIVPAFTTEALGKLRGQPFGRDALFALGLYALVTWSPIGLVAGILAGLWANARRPGQGRARRYGIAVLLLIGLPALGTAVLFALQPGR